MMNQSGKQGILIISAILLIVLLYYYLGGDPRVTDKETFFGYSVDITPSDDGGGDQVTSSDSRSYSHAPYTEPFSDDKSPSAATPNGNVPSFLTPTDKSPTPSVSYKQMHDGASQEPVVQEINSTVKVESPDKLPQSVIDRIKTFVFFVGHARSGHSIVGSLMDSHPHMVISHEYDLIIKLADGLIAPNKPTIFNALWKNTRREIVSGYRAKSTDYKGYSLFVDGLYHGKYVDHIDVIGDKKGRTTTDMLAHDPDSWLKSFNVLKSFNLPIKVIHVIRNPYDNIATAVWYTAIHQRKIFGEIKKSNRTLKMDPEIVAKFIQQYFDFHNAIVDAKTTYNLDVIEIHGKDLIVDPKSTILKICNNVGVPCYNKYLEICSSKIYKKESRTRLMVQWTDEQLKMIQDNIDKYSNLESYDFHSM